MSPCVSESDDPTWLKLFAILLAAPDDSIVDHALFRGLGESDVWDWACTQRSPFADTTGDPVWRTFAEGMLVWIVRDTLPLWSGLLALHPSSALVIHELTEDVNGMGMFAEHARAEWERQLIDGETRPWPTYLAFVPRDGDWGRFHEHARKSFLNVPEGMRVERRDITRPPR